VIDLCAAPGGKTTNIAEMMKNEGEIVALDKYEAKLNLILSACERLGLRIVKLRAADATKFDDHPADRVLLDAPCSGLGTLAKKPDIKWKRELSDITRLNVTQRALLENGARLVKPGGVLVYSTCTMEPEENEGIVGQFLAEHPEFHVDPADRFVHKDLVTPQGYAATLPHIHSMDGAFAARLVKSGVPHT
jgi:16S rRNA (cytosine967-C5)-methyltransferase